MKNIARVFIHGLDSSSRGTKGSYFRGRYPGMLIEDYSGSLEERMAQLEKGLSGTENLILVGSSYGGLMAALFACENETRVRRLVLLAPALGHADFTTCFLQPLQIPVTLYHGRFDVVVPPEPTHRIAERLFVNLDHHLVEDDHNLHRIFPTLDWDAMLEIPEKDLPVKAGDIPV
ncbi:MAG: alpha/beta fold hydrolase [Deltaproteobacteria bacterium]|nr:MAG: alpha/beta fold hydrolase [Deltaproteobacteria bacterium]